MTTKVQVDLLPLNASVSTLFVYVKHKFRNVINYKDETYPEYINFYTNNVNVQYCKSFFHVSKVPSLNSTLLLKLSSSFPNVLIILVFRVMNCHKYGHNIFIFSPLR